jgi:hypothetical protein
MMKKLAFFSLLACLLIAAPSCEDCEVNPDLIADLLSPSADIIQGEPVDWSYVVQSIKDNTECDIISAAASIGEILIDFFTDPTDNTSDLVYDKQQNVGSLSGGGEESLMNTINVFDSVGIYMVKTTADVTEVVTERDEGNNSDTGEVELKVGLDLFENASVAFKEKLNEASALVIVGEFTNGQRPTHYKGKPIYYAK